MDETGFILGVGDVTKRLCRNVRQNAVFKEFKNRESCSVVDAISTDGFAVTPLIIFKGSHHLAGWHKDAKLKSYWYGHSPKGYNNSILCLEYLKLIFEPETALRLENASEWRLLIFDGFESHLQLEIIEFCLDNNIIPLCLPSHTSHVLQPLDVGVFSPLKKYYRQEVSKLRCPVTKNTFPNLLALARERAFSVTNIQSGFRASGIYPYNPSIIIDTLPLASPETVAAPLPPTPVSAHLQAPFDLINFNPPTPTTPRGLNNLYLEAKSTYTSNSPSIIKLQTIISKFKNAAERNSAQMIMHQEGETYLRDLIMHKEKEGKKVDTRHLNSNAACIIERDTVLAELRQKRDQQEEETLAKKEKKELDKRVKEEEKIRREVDRRTKQEEKEQKAKERQLAKEVRQKVREEKEKDRLRRVEEKNTHRE
jgi:hypothetical protein